MINKEYILNFLKENKTELAERFQVEKIGLFGSYATDSQNDDSDIDIIVTMPSDYVKYFALKTFLEEVFKKKIDLGLEKNLRILVKNQIKDRIIYA